MVSKLLDAVRSGLRRGAKRPKAIGGALLRVMMPVAAGVVIGAAIMVVMVGPVGPEWVSFEYWRGGGKDISRSEVLRNVGLLSAALVGLGFGIWRAYTAHRQTVVAHRQAVVAEQGLFTDRFSTAVDHLGSEELPVRLGGIFALWRLAEDSPTRDEKTVWDILSAFVRNPPHEPQSGTMQPNGEDQTPAVASETRPVRPDIQAILDLLGTEAAALQRAGASYVLNLAQSRLCQAQLRDAQLSGTNLSGANLSGARLFGANLSAAHLWDANLTDAILFGARLPRAYLPRANLSGAVLFGADLTCANLSDAHLSGTDLTNADLTGADLSGADLSGAGLSGADLSGADLSGADLSGTRNLFIEQLGAACISEGGEAPRLPVGFTAPNNVCEK